MASKFPIVDARILAQMDEASALYAGSTGARGAFDRAQVGCIRLDTGYLSPYFITDPERMEVAFEDVLVLIYEKKIRLRNDLLPLLEQVTKSGKPLLIIAEDVEGEALATLVVRKLRGTLRIAAVKAPGFAAQGTSMLRDIARLTGGKVITEDLDLQLKDVRVSDLGRATKITIGKRRTVIESRAHYEQLLFGPDPSINSSNYPPAIAPLLVCTTPPDGAPLMGDTRSC